MKKFRKTIQIILALSLIISLSLSTQIKITSQEQEVNLDNNTTLGITTTADEETNKLIHFVNFARQQNGLQTLTTNDKLTTAANMKANDMFEHSYFDHISPDNITPWDWLHRVNYTYKNAGENLARSFETISGAHLALMQSPSHKANILGEKYTEIGVAIVRDEYNGKQTMMIVEFFGRQ